MGRTALIAGGSGALGSAVTAAFLTAGWRVVVPARGEANLEPHEALTVVKADLTDPASVAEAVGVAAGTTEAPLRAVVNLVGGYAAPGRVHETGIDDFEAQLRLNLRPTYLVTHTALPHLLDAGGGAIVCTSSRAAVRPFPGAAGYITAKAGVLALVECLAVEYGKDGIRANAVVPNVIDTPANRAAMTGDPSGWSAPADVAEVVRFLCEDGSGVVNGAHVPV